MDASGVQVDPREGAVEYSRTGRMECTRTSSSVVSDFPHDFAARKYRADIVGGAQAIESHDQPRSVTRFADETLEYRTLSAKLLAILHASLAPPRLHSRLLTDTLSRGAGLPVGIGLHLPRPGFRPNKHAQRLAHKRIQRCVKPFPHRPPRLHFATP